MHSHLNTKPIYRKTQISATIRPIIDVMSALAAPHDVHPMLSMKLIYCAVNFNEIIVISNIFIT